MSTVVVVTEENGRADEILRADGVVMRAQNLHPLLIAFRTFGRASTISVFGDHNGLAGKRRVNFIEMTCHILPTSWVPASVVFVGLDEIHQCGDVALRSVAQRLRSVGTETARIQSLRFLQHALGELMRGRILSSDFIAQSPNHDRWMIEVTSDHLAELIISPIVGYRVWTWGPTGLKSLCGERWKP